MNTEAPLKLTFPRQDLAQFSLFRADETGASTWASELPVANPRSVAQQLLQAVSELNRHPLAPEPRYRILEALADRVQVTLTNLTRRFLNQPLIMPEEPRQLAELTSELQGQLATAYSLVAVETLQHHDQIRQSNPARLVCESIQRALYHAGHTILLTFQLYHPVTLGGWLTLHQLYALAERQGLANLPVSDVEGRATSVSATYLQALLLGCCKPNQLRQSDLAVIYAALGEWQEHLRIGPAGSFEGLFMVDLASDQPPLYSSLCGSASTSQCRQLGTAPLVTYLKQLKQLDDAQGKPGIKLECGLALPSNMLSHLIDALGSMSMRNFSRVKISAPLSVSVGLGAAHVHASGERSFSQLLYGDEYIPPPRERVGGNPFIRGEEDKRDAWSSANPEEDYVRDSAGNAQEADLAHRVELDDYTRRAIEDDIPNIPPEPEVATYQMRLTNISPGGYCLDWNNTPPEEVRAGNIACVREERDEHWSIAVIRWVSALQDAHTLVGLELLSPRARAYGALVHKKTGTPSVPQRVLLLPEIPLVGQPQTLITPRAGFRERQKVSLLRKGERFLVQLTHQVSATASYAQFDFRYIKQLDEVLAEGTSGPQHSAYDSVWSNI
ncbi:GTPase [Seongchinamella sediminis]|uniref:GTPase n=1 Tax=Seongchinamella sediminis TaxID=2283635 RepID=A0A3L7E0Z2_9GAMM|nr:GTPase [Seongchinamella sediminis]RLQ23517.1 GTPase [Seongchinamella sediminis]